MEHKYKEFAMLKSAEEDEGSGQISGYFSTYDRIPDAYGDIVAPGAFTDTIKARENSGHPFPLCWNHDLNQIIGKVDSIKDDPEKGPLMTASFFDTPLAQEKREIVKSGVVYQFSFAYDIREAAKVELEDGTKAYELQKLDLFEVSIVPIPANQNAVMTDIKSGKRNSQKDEETIKEAISALESAANALKTLLDNNDGKDDPEDNPEGEDPKDGNPEFKQLIEKSKEILRRNNK